MALAMIYIPDDIPWGDYFCDETESVKTLEAPIDNDAWEVVGKPKLTRSNAIAPPPRWCRNGNKCPWRNCKFRHERCVHYDNWVRRGRKGHNCRSYSDDPDCKKSPEEGGCKYDHRDLTKLDMFLETLPCKTERELWDSFYERGLDLHISDVFDVQLMDKTDKALMIRSLKAADIEFIDNGHYMYIHYLDDTHYPPDD